MHQTNNNPGIRWGLILIAGFGTLLILLAGHVLFVALYSHLMDPGHVLSFYQSFARNTGAPFVIITGPLVMFLLARRVCRKAGGNHLLHGGLIIALVLVLEVLMIFLSGQGDFLFHPANIIAQVVKAGGAIAGSLFPWGLSRKG